MSALTQEPSTKENERIKTAWHELLFGVKCSIRYHEHRVRWYNRWRVATDFLVILSGGTVLATSLVNGNHLMAFLGALVSILSTMDLVIGYGGRSRDHLDYAKEFYDLQKKINVIGKNPTEKQLADLANERLEIEKYEPPHLRVLNMRCHNELVRAEGYGDDQIVPLGRWQLLVSNFYDWFPEKNRKGKTTP